MTHEQDRIFIILNGATLSADEQRALTEAYGENTVFAEVDRTTKDLEAEYGEKAKVVEKIDWGKVGQWQVEALRRKQRLEGPTSGMSLGKIAATAAGVGVAAGTATYLGLCALDKNKKAEETGPTI